MHKLFAGIQIADKPQEFIPITEVDLTKDVKYLKKKIAEEIKISDASSLEIIHHGLALSNDIKLESVVKPDDVIHIFQKTKQYERYNPSPRCPIEIAHTKELFALLAHIQISVSSRVTILQKILNEYPEFRRNLAAQAIIRDSVLFNTIHQNMTTIAENYPIICEAAPFIELTIKKELARTSFTGTSSSVPFSEATLGSPNSSEEENSLGASSSNESGTPASQNENSRTRSITRQQLQNALSLLDVLNPNSSVNSLSNISSRNTESNSPAASRSSSDNRERFTAEHMARAFSFLDSSNLTANPNPTPTPTSPTTTANTSEVQLMDTSDTNNTTADDTNDTIPSNYRNHEYAEQLRTMSQMGFLNHEENLVYLTLSNGVIGNAINLLISSLNE